MGPVYKPRMTQHAPRVKSRTTQIPVHWISFRTFNWTNERIQYTILL